MTDISAIHGSSTEQNQMKILNGQLVIYMHTTFIPKSLDMNVQVSYA